MTDFDRCVAMARIAVAEPTRSPEYIFRPGYNDAALMGREFLRLAEKAGELLPAAPLPQRTGSAESL
jgi:hypothetical protein